MGYTCFLNSSLPAESKSILENLQVPGPEKILGASGASPGNLLVNVFYIYIYI